MSCIVIHSASKLLVCVLCYWGLHLLQIHNPASVLCPLSHSRLGLRNACSCGTANPFGTLRHRIVTILYWGIVASYDWLFSIINNTGLCYQRLFGGSSVLSTLLCSGAPVVFCHYGPGHINSKATMRANVRRRSWNKTRSDATARRQVMPIFHNIIVYNILYRMYIVVILIYIYIYTYTHNV